MFCNKSNEILLLFALMASHFLDWFLWWAVTFCNKSNELLPFWIFMIFHISWKIMFLIYNYRVFAFCLKACTCLHILSLVLRVAFKPTAVYFYFKQIKPMCVLMFVPKCLKTNCCFNDFDLQNCFTPICF